MAGVRRRCLYEYCGFRASNYLLQQTITPTLHIQYAIFYASITNLMSDRHRISFVICFLLTSLLSDSVVLECLDQWTIARTILPRYIHNNRIDHLWRYLYTFIRITHFSRRHRWCTGIDTLYRIYADRDTPTAYTWHGISRVRGQGGKKRENK